MIELTALEYRLLLAFMNNRGIGLTRSRLLEELWDVSGEFVNDNTLTVYIKRLRDKIEQDLQTQRSSEQSGESAIRPDHERPEAFSIGTQKIPV